MAGRGKIEGKGPFRAEGKCDEDCVRPTGAMVF